MGVKIADVGIVKEWFGSSKDFIAACKKPGAPKPSGDPAALSKWLVSSMYCLILAYLANLGYYAMTPALGVVGGVIAFVQYSFFIFLQTWIFWFGFAHRQNTCCPFCIFCLEDIAPLKFIVGLYLMVSGVLQVLNYALLLPDMLSVMGPSTILYIVYIAFYALYAVCQLCAGVCLVQGGKKEAGVGAPPEQIGA